MTTDRRAEIESQRITSSDAQLMAILRDYS